MANEMKTLIKENKNLQKTIVSLSQQLANHKTVENYLKICEINLSPGLCNIVKSQINLKTKQGYRYSNDIKQLALNIYFLGPRVYKLLLNTLALPSITTLKRLTHTFEMTPGLNEFLFNILMYKIKHFTDEAKECILCADEMPLKSNLYYMLNKDEIIGFHQTNNSKTYNPAKFALVLMIRDININWKQPIAYFFVSGSCTGKDLQEIIIVTIQKLFNIGLNVKGFVTDMGSNFLSFSKNVYVTPA